MPWLATKSLQIPTKDLLSWYFEDPAPHFDQNKPLYINATDPSRYYSANQARRAIRRVAAGFKALGVKPGECVCVHSFNDIDVSILANGIVAAGAIFTGTNPSSRVYELNHYIKTAEIGFFVVEAGLTEHVQRAAKEAGIPSSRILVYHTASTEKLPDGLRSWRELFEHDEADWVRFDDYKTAKKTPAMRCFSSGTSGLPKAVNLCHYNLIGQHIIREESPPKPYQQRKLHARPHFHIAVGPSLHFSPLRNGIEMYVMKRFELEPFLRHIETHQITDATFAPPNVIAIINSPLKQKYSLRSLRLATSGAGPLDSGVQKRFSKLLSPETPFIQIYGMTESTCVTHMLPWPEKDLTGSVGRPVPGIDSKLVDDEGRDITGYDIRGEICMRGPTIVDGYLNNPKATRSSWDDQGYYHTGDIGYCDSKNGLLYVVDRKKDLIKVRGFQVAPAELEAVLLSHPLIDDAAVIGIQFSRDESELPRAYIVKNPSKEGQELSVEDVKQFTAERLAKYKRLDGGIIFVDFLPKIPSGKILKNDLRQKAAKEIGGVVKEGGLVQKL